MTRVKRGKPRIAGENAEQARANIAAKIEAFRHLLTRCAQGESLPPGFVTLPTSLRTFNAWAGEVQYPGAGSNRASLRANANATLAKCPELRKEVEALIASRDSINEAQSDARRDRRLSQLEAQVRTAKELTAIAQRELIAAKAASHRLEAENRVLTAQKQALELEYRRELDSLRSQITDLVAAVSRSDGKGAAHRRGPRPA